MRILFTIPHFYDPQGGGNYGSRKADPAPRRNALAGTIFSIHATLGPRQGLLNKPIEPSSERFAAEVEVVVCTTGERHLLRQLGLPRGTFRHHATRAEPLMLGFECHEVLKAGLGRFDYFCYLEDDIAVMDPLFFAKLDWFNRLAGDEAVLQPNRSETALGEPWDKLYIDGHLADSSFSDRWQDVSDRPSIEAEALGLKLRFLRVNNPHSGCFFLNARQMARWADQPDFLQRGEQFVGPLESAATYGVMRHFRVYKPARACAGFLEVRHLHNRYLGARLKLRPARPGAPRA